MTSIFASAAAITTGLSFGEALSQILISDFVLTFENFAVLLAFTHKLPPKQRLPVILVGMVGAAVARIAFAGLLGLFGDLGALAEALIYIPGALYLAATAYHLGHESLQDFKKFPQHAKDETTQSSGWATQAAKFFGLGALGAAILQISALDVAMSIDNVLVVNYLASQTSWMWNLGWGITMPALMPIGIAASVAMLTGFLLVSSLVARYFERRAERLKEAGQQPSQAPGRAAMIGLNTVGAVMLFKLGAEMLLHGADLAFGTAFISTLNNFALNTPLLGSLIATVGISPLFITGALLAGFLAYQYVNKDFKLREAAILPQQPVSLKQSTPAGAVAFG